MTTEQRKLVSVVFADIVGSTAFGSENDPEAVRSVMGSYFERMKEIAETHGGTVEKFIGDAVMVVFGVPRLHDDDAERAVRAALAMRDAMDGLNRDLNIALAARIGVNSGEAVAGSGAERQFLVTGDAVNVAARLQQAAEADEVVVGALTESLTRSAIEYAARPPITAKGKSEPLRTFRAIRARSVVPEQARGLPAMRAQLVGRQRELRLLLDTFERVRTERRAHLFTLVGNAGIGKSRLVGELLARIASGGGTRVLRGRCLPYGAGITYWPLMEVIRDDAGISSDDHRDAAIGKLDTRTAALGLADAHAVRDRLVAMLALRRVEDALPEVAPSSVPGEIAWAMREHISAVARDPTVIVIDDLQWAEATVFDIIDGIAERAEDAPLLLLCVARPTLLEAHPDWAAGRANAATITLDALSPGETTTLISRLLDVDGLPDELRARIVERSEGNPLFCEEFLRMLIDEGRVVRDGDRWRATAGAAEVRVPESIHALLAARIDWLGDAERRVLQLASIVGERFTAAELRALAPEVDVAHALAGLRRSGLVLEDRETREPGRYRFKHLLMRDVAYAGLSKSARADLHEAYAHELERSLGDRRDEFAEIVAHHIERAFTLSTEVRAPRTVVEQRAWALLERALALGERARRQQDLALLRRYAPAASAALAALPEAEPEDRIAVTLLEAALRALSAEYPEAIAQYREAVRLAHDLGRADLEARAHLGAASVLQWKIEHAEEYREFQRHVADAERLFREAGDPGGEIEAGLQGLEVLWNRGEVEALVDRGVELMERAREIGDDIREVQLAARVTPACIVAGKRDRAALYQARTEELVERLGLREPRWARNSRCTFLITSGDASGAIECWRRLEDQARREGDANLMLTSLRNLGDVTLIAQRDYERAAGFIDRALALSVRLGDQWSRCELTGAAAVIAAWRGDLAGAERMLAEVEPQAAEREDVFAIAYLQFCRARAYELAGRVADADRMYETAERTFTESGFGFAVWGANVTLDRAIFLADQGRFDDAAAALARAEERFGPQVGERADAMAKLRERIAAAQRT